MASALPSGGTADRADSAPSRNARPAAPSLVVGDPARISGTRRQTGYGTAASLLTRIAPEPAEFFESRLK
jgi:hypothetical protein